MGYEEFKIKLLKLLQEKVGDSAKVKFETLRKNNGTEVEAIVLSGGNPLMPAPHVEDLYESYQKQGEDGGLDACIGMIEQLYASADTIPVGKIFRPWKELEDDVRDRIIPVLINKEWNGEILKDAVYRNLLDFAIILLAQVFDTSDGSGTIRVNKNILDLWGVSENELWETAFRNLKKEKFSIQDLTKIMSEILSGVSMEDEDMLPESHTPENEPLEEATAPEEDPVELEEDVLMESGGVFQYLMTNSKRIYGAVGMLRTDLLQELAHKEGCSLFILPSSVHEIILVPDRGIFSAEMLRETVQSINREQVEKDERLSDNVYYFRKDGDKVEII